MKNKENEEQPDVSRRSFMQGLGLVGLGIAVSGLAGAADYEKEGATPQTGDKTTSGPKFERPVDGSVIEKRKYGKTGLELPILTMGCMFPVADNPLILRRALLLGLTTWDTADCYSGGKSEEGIGKYFDKYPEDRKKIFLSTKCDAKDAGPKMDEILARSLERMKTDYVDQFLLHMGTPKDFTPEMKIWMEKKKKEGKIRFFGASFHKDMAVTISALAKTGWCDAVMATCNYRLLSDPNYQRALEEANKAGMGFMAMKTQGGGALKADSEAEMKLGGHFLAKGYTEHQAKLMALWSNPLITTTTSLMSSVAILNMNVAAVTSRVKLTAADMAVLRDYAQSTRNTYCTACGACEAATGCEGIRDLVRFSMYENFYGDLALARQRYAECPAEIKSALSRLNLNVAEKACPNALPLAQILEKAMSSLA